MTITAVDKVQELGKFFNALKDRPLEPNDLWATMFQHLGINTDHAFPDHQGRPMPILQTGAPISELI